MKSIMNGLFITCLSLSCYGMGTFNELGCIDLACFSEPQKIDVPPLEDACVAMYENQMIDVLNSSLSTIEMEPILTYLMELSNECP